MKTRRGDVVLVLFPNSDLRTAKRRSDRPGVRRVEQATGFAFTLCILGINVRSGLALRHIVELLEKEEGVER